MKLEFSALVIGVVIGAILAFMNMPQIGGTASRSVGTDMQGNVNLGLDDRSLR